MSPYNEAQLQFTKDKFMKTSHILKSATALSLTLGLSLGIGLSAQAQDQTSASDESITEVVVTGTRTVKRSRLDTLAPVDVISAESLKSQASPELAETLSKLAPSITFPRPAITDGTDSVRPASLRGLAPDQTLVLVNGKRRHQSAIININGSVGRGSTAVDLNTIPTAALDRLEILRDGASAQYGSDAIAGVVNLMLRKSSSGGNVTASHSQYYTTYDAVRSSHERRDGKTYTLSGWKGFKLGEDGYLTASMEIKHREPTSRGTLDTRAGAPKPDVVTSRYGDPEERLWTVFLNWAKPLNDEWEAYGWASYHDRRNQSAANFRDSLNTGNVLALYPQGFLPMIDATTKDQSASFGLRGLLGGWDSDFNLSAGSNRLIYRTQNSVNASFGATSKKSFYSGYMQYNQVVASATFSQAFDLGLPNDLNVAFGFEGRSESFKIREGELQSYALGTVAPTAAAGAQGFPGFTPANRTDVSRDNMGAFVEVDTKLSDKFQVAAAVRAEEYSDFGSNVTGKLSGRYDFNPAFALRGAISTGFKAPSLQQQYFTATSTNFISGVPYDISTLPVSNPTAKALGAQELTSEDSTNTALGAVFRQGSFELTLDAYKIEINDRIIFSENILRTFSTGVAALLPASVGGARFFMNGVDTETTGLDLVARYRLTTSNMGQFDFGLAWNNGTTEITRAPTNNVLSTLSPAPSLFGRVSENLLIGSTPENKGNLSVDWKSGPWSASANATYYSNIVVAQNNASLDYNNGDKTLVNVAVNYKTPYNSTVSFGADNLFDTYPNQTPLGVIGNGAVAFSNRSPFGFGGRNLFVRYSQNF
jgi:iron complex outermembrane receptor protein